MSELKEFWELGEFEELGKLEVEESEKLKVVGSWRRWGELG